MAAFEVIALDTATPQLRAPGASDTYTFPRAVEMPLGTANGVLYLNGSKVVTSGSALTFDGTNFATTGSVSATKVVVSGATDSTNIALSGYVGGAFLNTPSGTSGYLAVNGAANYAWSSAQSIWYTSGSEQMRLTSTGLGIGTSSPGAKLHVSSAAPVIRIEETGAGAKRLDLSVDSGGVATISAPQSAQVLTFNTVGSERARITSGGDFGIGNLNPQYRLTVDKDTTSALALFTNSHASAPNGLYVDFSAASPNNATEYFLYCEDSTAQRATIRSNGGLANYQSNNVDLSDARTKKDIAPAPSYWGKIGALEIVTYKYKDQTHDDVNVGVIAQQVEQVEPVWVDYDGFGETPEDGIPLKTVYTKDITFAAIKALQEAMTRIEQLEARLAAAGI